MTIVFGFLVLLMIVMSLADKKSKDQPQKLEIDTSMFRCSPSFIIGSMLVVGILIALYTVFW